MAERLAIKLTLIKNIGLLVRFTFQIILFTIGIKTIAAQLDQTIVLFLTLIWCYVFMAHLRFRPTLVFINRKGQTFEE